MIGSVHTAMAIVNLLSGYPQGLGISEIAERLGSNKSTLHHIVHTLVEDGVLIQGPGKKYQLGYKVLEWGMSLMNQKDVIVAARAALQKLVEAVGETAHLGVLDQGEVVYLAKLESRQSIRISTRIGSRKPAYCTGLGKALLAYRSEAAVRSALEEPLTAYTEATLTEWRALLAALQAIREQGYAIDNQEYEDGLYCVAAPIFDMRGTVCAAISVSGPCFRFEKMHLPTVIQRVVRAACAVTEEMGGRRAGGTPSRPARALRAAHPLHR